MSTTYTSRANLQKPANADTGWDVALNANADTIDGMSAVGGLAVALKEVPSASLNVKVAAGSFRSKSGALVSVSAVATLAMTTASTNSVYVTDAGTVTVSTTGFPAGNIVRLATVVAGATTITSVADARVALASGGLSGPNLPAVTVAATPATIPAGQPLTFVNVASASVQNLPACSTLPAGTVVEVVDSSGAAATNNLSVTPNGTDMINGVNAARVVSTNYGGVRLHCNGVSKWIVLP